VPLFITIFEPCQTIIQFGLIPISKNTRRLQGIWKDKGFEKIVDLESEIKTIRKYLKTNYYRDYI
jgi:hypothetical protein